MAKASLADLQNEVLEALEKAYGAQVANAFAEAIEALRTGAELRRLLEAVEEQNVDEVMSAIHEEPTVFGELLDKLEEAFKEGGKSAIRFLPSDLTDQHGARLVMRFDVRNPSAEAWLKESSSRLVTNITETQRDAIRVTLEAGMRRGAGPNTVALDIVGRINKATGQREGGIIGLTGQQAGYVEAARAELASGDPKLLGNYLDRKLRDRRFDKEVSQAIKDEKPVPADTALAMITSYQNRMLRLRGQTIGRTESLTALRSAKHEAYRQAVEKGVDAQTISRTWRSAEDDKVRHTHEILDGQTAEGLEVPFISPSGARMRFPGDTSLGAGADEIVACRCDAIYSINFLGSLKPAAE
jgi:hypothetical protein